MPLEAALRQYVEALFYSRVGSHGRRSAGGQTRVEALIARFGLGVRPPRTLEGAASIAGITRERVRQLQVRLQSVRPPHPVYIPQLDRALQLVSDLGAVPASTAEQHLADREVSANAFHPESLLAAATCCGREAGFSIERDENGCFVGESSNLASMSKALAQARRQASKYGASNLVELSSRLSANGLNLDEGSLRSMLEIHVPA